MKTIKKRWLLLVNALLTGAVTFLSGSLTSCAEGVFVLPADSIKADTLVHAMYGVTPVYLTDEADQPQDGE